VIKYLKNIFFPFSEDNTESSHSLSDDGKVQVATCALLVEIAKADEQFTNEERNKIIKIMQDLFNLDKKYVDELIELSEDKITQSVSIYEFTSVINENFSADEKFELLKYLWKIVYLDETLHMREDHLMKKIGATLNIDHNLIIGAKLLVKEEIRKNNPGIDI
jgi:uncharacterized tellurite resistance protein B-like protein